MAIFNSYVKLPEGTPILGPGSPSDSPRRSGWSLKEDVEWEDWTLTSNPPCVFYWISIFFQITIYNIQLCNIYTVYIYDYIVYVYVYTLICITMYHIKSPYCSHMFAWCYLLWISWFKVPHHCGERGTHPDPHPSTAVRLLGRSALQPLPGGPCWSTVDVRDWRENL